jgi:hypothetical protein
MYLQNKYTKCYFSIIDNAKSRTLSPETKREKHHIIPKSLGGDNSVTNLVKLTLREHFICHLLLQKMTVGKAKTKMVYALWMLAIVHRKSNNPYKISARRYESIKSDRLNIVKNIRGKDHPNFGKPTGRTTEDFTPEWKANLSNAAKGRVPWNKGIPRTDAVKQAVSNANKGRKTAGFTGRIHTEESKQRISESTKAAWTKK